MACKQGQFDVAVMVNNQAKAFHINLNAQMWMEQLRGKLHGY